MRSLNVTEITPESYPPQLREIVKVPKVLRMAGSMPDVNDKFLCVVGARNHSQYGALACDKLLAGLKGYPIVIVSGLAIGIDSLAHKSALAYGLKTIAFPGSGLNSDVLYPSSRIDLAYKIVDSGGALLSPFEIDQQASHWTFPVRNMIMAAISHATLVIEGEQGSGTIITANHAVELNRDVMIVPGSIFSSLSYAPHLLYKSGATPVTSSEEILDVLGFDTRQKSSHDSIDDINISNLNIDEFSIFKALRYGPMSSINLMEHSSLSASTFNMVISELELKGIIIRLGDSFKIA